MPEQNKSKRKPKTVAALFFENVLGKTKDFHFPAAKEYQVQQCKATGARLVKRTDKNVMLSWDMGVTDIIPNYT